WFCHTRINNPELQVVIFIFLFLAYVLSVAGNLTIIILTLTDCHLKTPMYYFLRNFSFLEITFTSVSIPRFLGAIITKVKTISYNSCLAQLFFFIFMGVSEFFLLTAIVCTLLVFSSWLVSFLIIFPALMLLLNLDYCRSNIIDHFTCDYFPLLQLSCSDTNFLEMMGFSCAVFTLMFTLALIILSYTHIIRTVLRIPSTSQRTKAFSTCSSHMIVLSISYGSCIFMYIKPSAQERVSLSKGVAVLNTSVAPMLNPFIYSLRNEQVKQAFMDMARKTIFQKQMK
uniref:G-protein coupled receptors family 1 profile domain-containing protein n=1 Tax=Capra hircus TaxID=9925 RepID=A0A8C2NBB2_CAPHI